MERQHISLLEYFNRLQKEYLLYEIRLKIYPSAREKQKFRSILEYKRNKIEDISQKNNLMNIFNSDIKKLEIENEFFDELGVPRELSSKDKYFYYRINGDFSFQGHAVKLLWYDFSKNEAEIEYKNGQKSMVNLSKIKRIL
jgi:hypothetical protein